MNRLFIILLFTIVAAGCGNSNKKLDVTVESPEGNELINIREIIATGKVEPDGKIINLGAPAGGIVKAVNKKEGENIKKGDLIALLDNEPEVIRVDELRKQAEARVIQTDLEKLNLAETELRLKNRSALLESLKRLAAAGAEPAQNLEDLQTEVETLTLLAERQKLMVRLSLKNTEETEHQIRLALAEAEKKELRAPEDGVLLDILIRPGEAVAQFENYAKMAPSGKTIVRAEVDELFAGRLKTGQPARIRLPGSEVVIAEGSISFVSPFLKKKSLFSDQTGEQEDRLIREISIELKGEPGLILNTKVECVIVLN